MKPERSSRVLADMFCCVYKFAVICMFSVLIVLDCLLVCLYDCYRVFLSGPRRRRACLRPPPSRAAWRSAAPGPITTNYMH